ncbi:MAG: hypothetical protein Tsb009_34440 [Planctomycetaceae bacterium]
MAEFSLASFSADVTIPLNHRCMGLLATKSKKIVDPLFAHGFVLQGAGKPLVFVSVDWCEIRNGAYDRWREVLAQAARTIPERVLVTSIHQHDAPVTDLGAENFLASVGLAGEMFDYAFHEKAVQRIADALRDSLKSTKPVTQIGTGEGRVENIASNRRVIMPDGRVSYGRGSSSGRSKFHREAPVGEIDPMLKTLSFWNGDKPLLALSVYATHPMSYYGRGGVSADFPGLAREQRQRALPKVHQIYASGCSGDVTAGKFNDGTHGSRLKLGRELASGMKRAWEATKKHPLKAIDFRLAKLELPFRQEKRFQAVELRKVLENPNRRVIDRIYAAMSLSSRHRVMEGNPIDFPCLDFGPAQLVLFPGESFVGYQLMAQRMNPDKFVMSVGYGECWPGYIPTKKAFDDNFEDKWLWVPPGCEPRIQRALKEVLAVS